MTAANPGERSLHGNEVVMETSRIAMDVIERRAADAAPVRKLATGDRPRRSTSR